MSSKIENPDLALLCSQVFDGIGRMHSEEIISSRRALLFQEAAKMLYAAKMEGKEFEREMASVEQLIENHLSADANQSPAKDGIKPQKSAAENSSGTDPDRPYEGIAYNDGSQYVGQLQDGRPDGEGTFGWADGSTYKGSFKNGQMHWIGKYTDPNGNEYIGDFVHGERHGEGTFTRANGSSYSGGWSHGVYHGHGKHIRDDGTVIEGQYVDGRIEGYATQIFADGSSYKGEWKNNGRHGQGVFTKKNGTVQSGLFENGLYKPEPKPQRTRLKKMGRATTFLILMFGAVTFYQSWSTGVSFFDVLESRRAQLAELAGTAAAIFTEEGVAMEGIDDIRLNEEDVAVQKEAQSGDPDAMVDFAQVLYQSDSKEALAVAHKWLKKAANQGHAGAREELAMMYFAGGAGIQDYPKSYAALSLAQMDGEPVSAASFDRLLSRMSDEEMSQAQDFIQRCIEGGIDNCQF